MRRWGFCGRLIGVLWLGAWGGAWLAAQQAAAPAAPQAPTAAGWTIRGTVQAEAMAVPGATVTVSDPASGQSYITSSGANGDFEARVAHPGVFTVTVQQLGFAAARQQITVAGGASTPVPPMAITLNLAAPAAAAAPPPSAAQVPPAGRGARAPAPPTGYENLQMNAVGGEQAGAAPTGASPEAAGVPGMSSDQATESMAVNGAAQSDQRALNADTIQQALQVGMPGGPGAPGIPGGAPGAPGQTSAQPGPGGFGRGNFGDFGGRGNFSVRTLSNRFNQPHGSIFYSLGNASLDAAPFSLTGQAEPKSSHAQQRFGGSVSGPFKIPHVFDDHGKTFYFLNFTGNRSTSLVDETGTVPTLLQRMGNFSQTLNLSGATPTPVTIYNPATGAPFAADTVSAIAPAAAALLNFIPDPNATCPASDTAAQCARFQNYQRTAAELSNANALALRVNHNFSGSALPGPGRGQGSSVRLNFTYMGGNTATPGTFPSEVADTATRGINALLGFTSPGEGPLAGWINDFSFGYNRSRTNSNGLFANNQNIAAQLGIGGVSPAPIDWGLPSLDFTNFTSVADTTPQFNRDQTATLSDGMVKRVGKHQIRWGGDFRLVENNLLTDTNARGTFVFSGLYTQATSANSAVLGATGYDLADFLLGDAQQTSVTYGGGVFYFRQNFGDLFAQDNWQARGNLTIQYGVRYEYVSPFRELDDRLTNLLAAPGFSSVTPVAGGALGQQLGLPQSLIHSTPHGVEPRTGFAWKTKDKLVVTGGYGINFVTTAYQNMPLQLARQEPFVTNLTLTGTAAAPLTLANGFPASEAAPLQDTYGVNPYYQMGYVQLWNFGAQRDLSSSTVINLFYSGSEGTDLDMLRAPNRTATGLLLPNVTPFLYETSEGDSNYNAATALLSRRLSHGVSFRASYTFSKSIDDTSATSGSAATTVAQNDRDLAAERALSSFNHTHVLNAAYEWQLPFGLNHKWLNTTGALASLLGDWQITGTFEAESGAPLTPYVQSSPLVVAQGNYQTLRPNLTGEAIALAQPSATDFFNTRAFVAPATGSYGDAGRNIIIGPGLAQLNTSLSKIMRFGDYRSFEVRFDGTNVLNHPNFSALNTALNSALFGQVTSVATMRVVDVSLRLRF